MRTINIKIFTLLIIGVVALTATAVFAAKNYNSSKSNTSSIAIIDQQVGDMLLRYGAGGIEINKVTDALAVGIGEIALKAMLSEIGIGDEGVNEIFTKLDELGAGFIKLDDEEKAISTTDTGDTTKSEVDVFFDIDVKAISTPDTINAAQGVEEIEIAVEQIKRGEISTPSAGDAPQAGFKEILGIESETEIIEIKDGDDTTVVRKIPGRTTYQNITLERAIFHDASKNIIQNLRAATPEERESLINELQTSRGLWDTEIVSMDLKIRENAQELRDNFRKRVETTIGHVDHGKTARIANAHGKGLRMINRFRSATARFNHILGRLESRVLKLEARGYEIDSFFDVQTSIEEANNISIENEAKLIELKAKYESLLLGENLRGIGEEARAIAKELKTEIENLHAKLREIVDGIKQATKDYNTTRSNTK